MLYALFIINTVKEASKNGTETTFFYEHYWHLIFMQELVSIILYSKSFRRLSNEKQAILRFLVELI